MPDVYDDEKTSDDQLRDITGINKADEKAMEARAHEDLAAAEESGGEPSDDAAAAREKEKVNDAQGGWATNVKDSAKQKVDNGRARVKKIIAIVTTTLAVASAVAGFLAAPHLIVNHLRELILGKISQLQTHQTFRYRRKYTHRIKGIFSPTDRRGSKLLQEMNRFGYHAIYDDSTRTRITGFQLRNGTGVIGLGTTEQLQDFINKKHPLRSARWKTKRINAMYERYGIPRKSVVLAASNLDESVDRIMNKRMADTVLADEPGSVSAREASAEGEETPEQEEARRARNSEAHQMIEADGSLDELREKLKRGTPIAELTDDERAILRIGLEFDPNLAQLLDGFTDASIGQRIMGGVKGLAAGAVTDIAARICDVKQRLSAATFAARVYRARALMQYASIFIAASDQTRAGAASGAMMNELMKRVTAVDGNGQPIGASSGMMRILKGKFSKSSNDVTKEAYSVDGSMTGVAAAVNDAVKDFPATGEDACRVWQNPLTQIGGGALELIPTLFTGGGFKAGASAVKQGLTTAMKNVLSKKMLKSLAFQAAIELSFEGALMYLQIQAQKSLSLNFTGQEKGAQLGEILAAGAGTMNKQRSLESGMVPATTQQLAQIQSEYIAWKKEETKKQSLYTRIFDYDNYDSVAFNLASTVAFMPMSPHGIGLSLGSSLHSTAAGILSNPVALFSNLGNMFTGSAFAQSDDEISYDSYTIPETSTSLATDTAGNLIPVMRTDIEEIDPEENIEWLIESGDIKSDESYAPNSDRFKKHITNCVEGIDILTVLENHKEDNPAPEFDCLARTTEGKRFKAHIAYLDMVDDMDAWLFPEDITAATPSTATSNTPSGPTGNQPTPGQKATKEVDTSGLSCAGTPSSERIVEIVGGVKRKLCDYGTIRSVDASWSQSVSSMIAAATADGISLGPGGGFRSAAGQIEARRRNCGTSHYAIYEMPSRQCRPPTARPGQSNHELGLAIDFENMCYPRSTCSGNARYDWLVANAGRFGVKKLSSEAWHWSIDGH